MSARYVVDVYEGADRCSRTDATDFAHCVQIARMMAAQFPANFIIALNIDRADTEFDGLTAVERVCIAAAIDVGHADAKRARGR